MDEGKLWRSTEADRVDLGPGGVYKTSLACAQSNLWALPQPRVFCKMNWHRQEKPTGSLVLLRLCEAQTFLETIHMSQRRTLGSQLAFMLPCPVLP